MLRSRSIVRGCHAAVVRRAGAVVERRLRSVHGRTRAGGVHGRIAAFGVRRRCLVVGGQGAGLGRASHHGDAGSIHRYRLTFRVQFHARSRFRCVLDKKYGVLKT